jgi:GTPase SAR1 family protein
LAKLDCCGAKCLIFDISGKFRNLWERYYGDADAVIFCWRLDCSEADQRTILETVRREIPDDVPILIFGHEFVGTTTARMNDSSQELQQQQHQQRMPIGKLQRHVQKLQQRRSISKMSSTTATATTTAKTTPLATELFLPNYHSNLMYAICGSAKTGKGIREAMEWLIPLAKRQAKMRSQEAAAAAAAVANHRSR